MLGIISIKIPVLDQIILIELVFEPIQEKLSQTDKRKRSFMIPSYKLKVLSQSQM